MALRVHLHRTWAKRQQLLLWRIRRHHRLLVQRRFIHRLSFFVIHIPSGFMKLQKGMFFVLFIPLGLILNPNQQHNLAFDLDVSTSC